MGCSTSALNQATLAGQRQKQSKVIPDDRSPEPSLGDYTQQLSLPKLSPIQAPNKNFRIRRSSSSERRPELDVAQLPSKLVHLSGLAISCNGKQKDGKLFPLNQKESFKKNTAKGNSKFSTSKDILRDGKDFEDPSGQGKYYLPFKAVRPVKESSNKTFAEYSLVDRPHKRARRVETCFKEAQHFHFSLDASKIIMPHESGFVGIVQNSLEGSLDDGTSFKHPEFLNEVAPQILGQSIIGDPAQTITFKSPHVYKTKPPDQNIKIELPRFSSALSANTNSKQINRLNSSIQDVNFLPKPDEYHFLNNSIVLEDNTAQLSQEDLIDQRRAKLAKMMNLKDSKFKTKPLKIAEIENNDSPSNKSRLMAGNFKRMNRGASFCQNLEQDQNIFKDEETSNILETSQQNFRVLAKKNSLSLVLSSQYVRVSDAVSVSVCTKRLKDTILDQSMNCFEPSKRAMKSSTVQPFLHDVLPSSFQQPNGDIQAFVQNNQPRKLTSKKKQLTIIKPESTSEASEKEQITTKSSPPVDRKALLTDNYAVLSLKIPPPKSKLPIELPEEKI